MSLWYYGTNSGNEITVQMLDNVTETTAEPAADDWVLRWADEFSGAAGTIPTRTTGAYEVGDGGLNGIHGWGNGEFEYYTDDPENASTDGAGNLVITAKPVDDGR